MSDFMIEVEVDGKHIAVPDGSKIIDAAKIVDSYVPHFCYHKRLKVVASCRMCLVEVEQVPKLVPACATVVSKGMVIKTKSEKVVKAQQAIMEFLLLNHPLDCPICDQGGECQLQDIAVGYGKGTSRYAEQKRIVFKKQAGPLISMDGMDRCILCTRCVRFGKEIAGCMELGVVGKGEHSEVTSFLNSNINSELSGNMIDICPVGALTSQPFRFTARSWELSQYLSISSHDALGSNLIIQTKKNRVMRVLPFENDEINQSWISDKDRFSYEGLTSCERLTDPMIKRNGVWEIVDWNVALDYIARQIHSLCLSSKPKIGEFKSNLAFVASPNSTLEELFLTQKLADCLGAEYEFRIRQQDFDATVGAPWLGMSINELSKIDTVFIVGSNLRNDNPLLAARLRQSASSGAKIILLNSMNDDALIKTSRRIVISPDKWLNALTNLINKSVFFNSIKDEGFSHVDCELDSLAQDLIFSKSTAIFLGSAFLNHQNYNLLYKHVSELAKICSARVGFLLDSANIVGAHLLYNSRKKKYLTSPRDIFNKPKRAYVLIGNEPEFDSANPRQALNALHQADFVVSLTAFKPINLVIDAVRGNSEDFDSLLSKEGLLRFANRYGEGSNTYVSLCEKRKEILLNPIEKLNCYADVLLPIALFTENEGTFINMAGKIQTFKDINPAIGNSKPAWKVLRVLGNILNQADFLYQSNDEVKELALSKFSLLKDLDNSFLDLSNNSEIYKCDLSLNKAQPNFLYLQRISDTPIYHTDPLVRRAVSLQRTNLAKEAHYARLSQIDYEKLCLSQTSKVRVWQDDKAADVFAVMDCSLPEGIICLNNSIPAAANLGTSPSMVKVERLLTVEGANGFI